MAEPSPDDHPSIYSILDSIRKYNKKNAAGSAFIFEDNEKSREDTRGRHSSAEGGASTRNNSAIDSIADEVQNSKNKFSLVEVEEAPQTNTAAFKRWFGKTQVVNEDGSPKVMYHGTATEIKSATNNIGLFDGENPDIRYSLRDSDGYEISMSDEDVEENKQYVANMTAVARLQGNPMAKESGVDFFTAGTDYFRSIGGKAENPVLGVVALDEKGIRHLINRRLTWRKTALLRAVKPVIEQGRILHVENDHHNKDTAIIAATVELDGQDYYMGVVVSQNSRQDNTYEVHDAVVVQKQRKGVDALTKTPSADESRTRRGDNDPSIAIILSDLSNYNRQFAENGEGQNKYSLRDVDTTNTTMETLLEENRALRDTVRALNQQLKGDAGPLDEKAVRRVASGLKKKYASTVPLNTLTENLTRAFNAMQSAENTRQSEAAMEMMGNIALDMVQKSQIADREAYDASRDLRERFRKSRIGLTDTQWQEAESLYDTARDFRRAVFGKWNVPAQNGRGVTTLDMIWDDLVAEYPQYFSADASEGDMVQQVLAMLDATAIKYDNPFGAEIEQVASGVATEIYQEYLGAGRENGSKNAAVDKLMDQLADAKKTILEQKRGLRRANRDIADMRAKREAQALRRKQNQDYNQVKNEIIRKKGQLLKKLEAPKSGAFIPASMYDAVHELLKAIDFEGKLDGITNKPLTREMLDRAKNEYIKLNRPDKEGYTGPMAAFCNGDLESHWTMQTAGLWR